MPKETGRGTDDRDIKKGELMNNIIYIVIETCSGNADATAYKTRENATRAIERLSGQSREEWAFHDGTIYEGNNNYETTAQIIESMIYG